MVEKKKIAITTPLVIAIILLSAIIGAMGLLLYQHHLSSGGTIQTPTVELEVYVNGILKPNETSFSWGSDIMPGDTITKNLTVVNTGNVWCRVTLETTGLATDWTLTWTGEDTILGVGESVEGDLTLSVPTTASPGTFNLDHKIKATEES